MWAKRKHVWVWHQLSVPEGSGVGDKSWAVTAAVLRDTSVAMTPPRAATIAPLAAAISLPTPQHHKKNFFGSSRFVFFFSCTVIASLSTAMTRCCLLRCSCQSWFTGISSSADDAIGLFHFACFVIVSQNKANPSRIRATSNVCFSSKRDSSLKTGICQHCLQQKTNSPYFLTWPSNLNSDSENTFFSYNIHTGQSCSLRTHIFKKWFPDYF